MMSDLANWIAESIFKSIAKYKKTHGDPPDSDETLLCLCLACEKYIDAVDMPRRGPGRPSKTRPEEDKAYETPCTGLLEPDKAYATSEAI